MTAGNTRDRAGPVARLRAVPRWVWGATAAIVVVIAAVVTILVVASGPDSPGAVTFAAGGQEVAADPIVYCDVLVTDCTSEPSAVASLPMPPGTDVDVRVPDEVMATPWQVAFTFIDETGAQQGGRSEVFGPGARGEYLLALPDDRWRLERVEVQQFGASLTTTAQGDLFSTRSAWVAAATG